MTALPDVCKNARRLIFLPRRFVRFDPTSNHENYRPASTDSPGSLIRNCLRRVKTGKDQCEHGTAALRQKRPFKSSILCVTREPTIFYLCFLFFFGIHFSNSGERAEARAYAVFAGDLLLRDDPVSHLRPLSPRPLSRGSEGKMSA